MGDILFINFKTHELSKSGPTQKQTSAEIVFFPGIRVERSQPEAPAIMAPKVKARGPRKPRGKKQA